MERDVISATTAEGYFAIDLAQVIGLSGLNKKWTIVTTGGTVEVPEDFFKSVMAQWKLHCDGKR